jgi:hypothetical protein
VIKLFIKLSLICFATLLIVENGFSHGNEDHSQDENTKIISKLYKKKLKQVNDSYINLIKPIFSKACFDCHSSKNEIPWYGKIPGLSYLIEYDKNEGIKHLNMDEDFPFKGHGTPQSDLKAISESLTRDLMPPLRYRLINWNNKLKEEEKKLVLKWLNRSVKKLESNQD